MVSMVGRTRFLVCGLNCNGLRPLLFHQFWHSDVQDSVFQARLDIILIHAHGEAEAAREFTYTAFADPVGVLWAAPLGDISRLICGGDLLGVGGWSSAVLHFRRFRPFRWGALLATVLGATSDRDGLVVAELDADVFLGNSR